MSRAKSVPKTTDKDKEDNTSRIAMVFVVVLGTMAAWHAMEVQPLMTLLHVPFHMTLTPTRVGLFVWMAALILLTASGAPTQPQLVLILGALFAAAWMSREALVFSFLFGDQGDGAAVLSCSAVPADRNLAGQTLLSKFVSSLMLGSGMLKSFDVPAAAAAAAKYDPLVGASPLYGILQPYFEILLGSAHLAGNPNGLLPMAAMTGVTTFGVARALQEGRRPTCACAGVGSAPISTLTLAEYGGMCAVSLWQLYNQYFAAPAAASVSLKNRAQQQPQKAPEQQPPANRFERLDDDGEI